MRERFWLFWTLALLAGAALIAMMAHEAHSQQHHHIARDGEIHDKFYNDWERPDMGAGYGCCHRKDCYPTSFKREAGKWYALKRKWITLETYELMDPDDEKSWLHIPERMFEHNLRRGEPLWRPNGNQPGGQRDPRDSPDGRSHVCMLDEGGVEGVHTYTPLCAVLGNGT